MEVHEQNAAAATHQPPCGHRRIDTARKQARDAPAHADRHPAGARFLAEVVERVVGERLDVNRELGVVRSTVQPFASLIRPPTSRSICGDVSGKRLSARRAETRNVRAVAVAEIGQDRLRDCVDIERSAPGPRKVRHAEHA